MNNILIISPTPSHPQNAGNRERIYVFCKNMQLLGFNIYFFYYDLESKANHVTQAIDTQNIWSEWNNFYLVPNLPRENLTGYVNLLDKPFLRKFIDKTSVKLYPLLLLITHKIYASQLFKSFIGLIDGFIGRLSLLLKVIFPSLYRILRDKILGNKENFFEKKSLNQDDNDFSKNLNDVDKWYNSGIDFILDKLKDTINFDCVICNYVFMSKALTIFDNTVFKIIDTHDIFTDRNENYKKLDLKESFFSTTLDNEIYGLNRADLIITIQNRDEAFLKKYCKKEIMTLGHSTAVLPIEWTNERTYCIGFMGSGNVGNIDAVNYIIDNIIPFFEKAHGLNIKFLFAGKVCSFIKDSLVYDKMGEVESKDDFYNRVDIILNPIRTGTGLKIKNIEALGRGKVLLTSIHGGIGIENLYGDLNADFFTNDKNRTVKTLIRLIVDEEFYSIIRNLSLSFAYSYNRDIQKQYYELYNKINEFKSNQKKLPRD